jgi:hypothetical protein
MRVPRLLKSDAMAAREKEDSVRVNDVVRRALREECGIKHRLYERKDLCPRCRGEE